jgi:hypothetical protein
MRTQQVLLVRRDDEREVGPVHGGELATQSRVGRRQARTNVAHTRIERMCRRIKATAGVGALDQRLPRATQKVQVLRV